jgi:hypothetical protein
MNEPRRAVDVSEGRLRRPVLSPASPKQQEPNPDESDHHDRETPISRIVHGMAPLSRLSPRSQCHGAEGQDRLQLERFIHKTTTVMPTSTPTISPTAKPDRKATIGPSPCYSEYRNRVAGAFSIYSHHRQVTISATPSFGLRTVRPVAPSWRLAGTSAW